MNISHMERSGWPEETYCSTTIGYCQQTPSPADSGVVSPMSYSDLSFINSPVDSTYHGNGVSESLNAIVTTEESFSEQFVDPQNYASFDFMDQASQNANSASTAYRLGSSETLPLGENKESGVHEIRNALALDEIVPPSSTPDPSMACGSLQIIEDADLVAILKDVSESSTQAGSDSMSGPTEQYDQLPPVEHSRVASDYESGDDLEEEQQQSSIRRKISSKKDLSCPPPKVRLPHKSSKKTRKSKTSDSDPYSGSTVSPDSGIVSEIPSESPVQSNDGSFVLSSSLPLNWNNLYYSAPGPPASLISTPLVQTPTYFSTSYNPAQMFITASGIPRLSREATPPPPTLLPSVILPRPTYSKKPTKKLSLDKKPPVKKATMECGSQTVESSLEKTLVARKKKDPPILVPQRPKSPEVIILESDDSDVSSFDEPETVVIKPCRSPSPPALTSSLKKKPPIRHSSPPILVSEKYSGSENSTVSSKEEIRRKSRLEDFDRSKFFIKERKIPTMCSHKKSFKKREGKRLGSVSETEQSISVKELKPVSSVLGNDSSRLKSVESRVPPIGLNDLLSSTAQVFEEKIKFKKKRGRKKKLIIPSQQESVSEPLSGPDESIVEVEVQKEPSPRASRSDDFETTLKTTSVIKPFSDKLEKPTPVFNSKYCTLDSNSFWMNSVKPCQEISPAPKVPTKGFLKEVPMPASSCGGLKVGASAKTMLSVLAETSVKGKPGRKKKQSSSERTKTPEVFEQKSSVSMPLKKVKKLSKKSKHKNIVDPLYLSNLESILKELKFMTIEKSFPYGDSGTALPSIFKRKKFLVKTTKSGGRRGRPPKRVSIPPDDPPLLPDEQRLPLKKRHHKVQSDIPTTTSSSSNSLPPLSDAPSIIVPFASSSKTPKKVCAVTPTVIKTPSEISKRKALEQQVRSANYMIQAGLKKKAEELLTSVPVSKASTIDPIDETSKRKKKKFSLDEESELSKEESMEILSNSRIKLRRKNNTIHQEVLSDFDKLLLDSAPVIRPKIIKSINSSSDALKECTVRIQKLAMPSASDKKRRKKRKSNRTGFPTIKRKKPKKTILQTNVAEPVVDAEKVEIFSDCDTPLPESECSSTISEITDPSSFAQSPRRFVKGLPNQEPYSKKKYLSAGLFSLTYKSLSTESKKPPSISYIAQNHPHGLLPPPYHCGKSLRTSVEDFKLPFDLWWLSTNKELPARDVMATWNYKKIKNNVYVDVESKAARIETGPCHCLEGSNCGDECINRVIYTECDPRTCPRKEDCTNNAIQRHRIPSGVDRFMTSEKGWGVRTKFAIPASTFIMEYVGEIVSDKEFKLRMLNEYENDSHHYCLQLDGGTVIDGHRMGGECRFVNHSCEPNCEMQKWHVGGYYRMALFSKQNILPNEELTYDYNFSLFNASEGQVCKCGSTECRGVIGARKGGPVKSVKKQPKTTAEIPKKQVTPSQEVVLSSSVKAYVREHKLFMLRSLKKAGRVVETIEANKSVEEMIQTGLTAMNNCRSVHTRKLAGAIDDPNVSRVLKIAQILKEVHGALLSIKDQSGKTCARYFKRLPPKKSVPRYYEYIHSPVDFVGIERNIKSGFYSSVELFDRDVLLVFQNALRFYGRDSSQGEASSMLRTAYYELKAKFSDKLTEISGVPCFKPSKKRPDESKNPEDVIRCACGLFYDEGLMIQCEKCQMWQHVDCVGESKKEEEEYFCFKCSGKPPKIDIHLVPQPEYACPGEMYFLSLSREGGLQVRVADTVYVLRASVATPASPTQSEFSHGGVPHKMMSPLKGPSAQASTLSKGNYPTYKSVNPLEVRTDDMDIFRIERLWIDGNGERFAFGHHFLRPHETFHEPSRKFFSNEVFRVPLYEVLPLDSIWKRCWVLDVPTFTKGRPNGAIEEDVYICEYRVDKSARLFNKISKSKFPVCSKWFAFDNFDIKIKAVRNYTPHKVPEKWARNKKEDESRSSGFRRRKLKAKLALPKVKKKKLDSTLSFLLKKISWAGKEDASYLLDKRSRGKKLGSR